MQFKNAFFAIIVFGLMIVAAGVWLIEQNQNYGSGISSDLGELDKFSETYESAESQKGRINPQSGEASSDFETETFRGGYGIITNIFSDLRLVFGDDGMIDSVAERYGLPDYVTGRIIALMVFAITFAIIAIIFRLGRTAA